MRKKISVYLSAGIILFSLTTAQAEENSEKNIIRRYAIIVGSNNGGKERVKLRYAVSDARSVLNVMNKMGGVTPGDSMLIVEPDRKMFMSGLEKLGLKVKSADAGRVEVFFYYSGHSDEEAILLGGEKVFYTEISKIIKEMPADVRIAVLDSCSSGAFTRIKGGRMRSPFLIDSSYDMKGYAFMTSSSSDEASQESDRIKGSFFTHYLVSGLRGAADMTGDKRITLSEAYQFAYNETLARTEKTLSGPQHPNYNIQMSGTGDVVMTDISKSSALLVIDKSLSGRLFIRDNRENLVVELKKTAGRDIQIGLEEGSYSILNERDGSLYEAEVELVEGRQYLVTPGIFKMTDKEYAIARGDDKEDTKIEEYRIEPWYFSLYPNIKENADTIHYGVLNLFGAYSGKIEGFELGIGPSIVKEDMTGVQLTAIGNYNGNDAKGVQLSCFFNITGKNFKGVQLNGYGINYAGKDMTGVQIASIMNVAGGNMDGVQAGIINYTIEKASGAQVGLVNIADNVYGTQIGLVNIAGEMNGVPIGLVNISENGSIDAVAWGSNLTAVNIGARFRSGYVYTILSAGWNNLDKKIDNSFATGFHIGCHIPAGTFSFEIDEDIEEGSLYFNIDIGNIEIDNDDLGSSGKFFDQSVYQCRFIAGYNITKSFSIFAGCGASYIINDNIYDDTERKDFKDGRWEPLYLAGVQYIFRGKN